MVGWREREMYMRHKRADIYGSGLGVGRKVTNITPFKIFIEKIRKDGRFLCLKGYSSWNLSLDRDMKYYKRYYKDTKRREKSDWYLYMGEGDRRAIVQLPQWDELRCKAFLKILWVPAEMAGKGVGSEVMDVLKSHVRFVDDLCKAGEKYDGKFVTCNSFILYLIPNSFIVKDGYWNVTDKENRTDKIDWTNDPEAPEKDGDPDFMIRDETYKYINKEDLRLSLKELQAFYMEKHGFVVCEELGITETFDWETGRVSRDLNITARSFCHQRWPLLWPPENLEYHERDLEE